ncbi:MAG TPA: urate oxidase [Puia sp.]
MITRLDSNAYGKNAINLSKILRFPDRHEIRQIAVNISLQGDFETAHTIGDNTKILPTDTMKNTVYALAKDHFNTSIEEFGIVLVDHFLSHNPQVSAASAGLTEFCWSRMIFDGAPHSHSFVNGGSEKHTAFIRKDRQGISVTAGIKDLLILKTTDSGFERYIKDQYTTLKETSDRIFSTECEVSWKYQTSASSGQLSSPDQSPSSSSPPPAPDFTGLYNNIRNSLLQTFSRHKSLSVQHTLYAMGENVLKEFAAVEEITLRMPNKHHIPFNLEQFGMDNQNEIFIATDEPYGYITGTLIRDPE